MTVPNPITKSRKNSAFKHLMTVHWWMAACYVIIFSTGMIMVQLPANLDIRSPMYSFHKSMGVLTMALLTWRILTLLRVWWKKYTRRFPKLTLPWFQTVALHTSLYVFMWGVPVAGYFLSNSFRPNNVKFFGLPLPDIFPVDSSAVGLARNLHFWLSYTFLAFILLHSLDQWKVIRANLRRFRSFLGKAKTKGDS
ncbi:cytochrome b/b6 domain-containing protein [Spirulina subsalsa FACHB-351]|uniref:Cytochrome b/b6 domain-containing protein n=1 Tax=Spirulina subsalsa FACHB-351 TaxID=234711 RepID=A0ABT3L0R1_9CYAN|nr:cytochrome b/b6 domain-containing protein [Spirulina subsalsa]MCW6035088.1 cytochrome b/b6 domain-containing protein [Spirulina subsalsa FACHB-351]